VCVCVRRSIQVITSDVATRVRDEEDPEAVGERQGPVLLGVRGGLLDGALSVSMGKGGDRISTSFPAIESKYPTLLVTRTLNTSTRPGAVIKSSSFNASTAAAAGAGRREEAPFEGLGARDDPARPEFCDT